MYFDNFSSTTTVYNIFQNSKLFQATSNSEKEAILVFVLRNENFVAKDLPFSLYFKCIMFRRPKKYKNNFLISLN